MALRLVFMGTPDFAVPTLSEIVASGIDVAAVYTQPPRRRGRGHKLQPSPIGKLAEDYGLTVSTPLSMKAPEEAERLRDLSADVAVVVAYGQILPQPVLQAPRLGCLNVHASLLPRWRGAAPIQRAMMAGDAITGVQVMQMEEGLDTGPILLSETTPIGAEDTYQTVHDRLAPLGASLMLRALPALERGGLTATPQSEDGVTYAKKITSDEARIDWHRPAVEVDCLIRGLSPFPGAYTEFSGTRTKILLSSLGQPTDEKPGTILSASDEGIAAACGDGQSVLLKRLQRAGKAAQHAADFLRGHRVAPGTVLS